VPTHGVVPIWLGEASHTVSLGDSCILLTDFSESFQLAVDIRQFSHTPFMLRSPEILLEPTTQVSFPAEIWSLACAVFSLMGQEHLFGSWFPSKDRILAEHVDALGYLPQKWWESWTDRTQYSIPVINFIELMVRRVVCWRIGLSTRYRSHEKNLEWRRWTKKRSKPSLHL
jgi:hypothetical protein